MSAFDIIGDVHGHADKLVQLLKKLGYTKTDDIWSHPNRTLISIGDLIDRGPQQREVVDILKTMEKAGKAIVIMGNHEFNAVSWYLKDEADNHLRPHTSKNHAQHCEFLQQADINSSWYKEPIEWFMSLPLLFETEQFCCAHAAWDKTNIAHLKSHLTDEFKLRQNQWVPANTKSHPLYNAIEYCLKGPELGLPSGHSFEDGGGHTRTKMRLKWWDVKASSTYRTTAVSVPDPSQLPDEPLPAELLSNVRISKPVFFGHYWMTGKPQLLSDKIACLDWSVVKENGQLVAYRFDGESSLSESKLVAA